MTAIASRRRRVLLSTVSSDAHTWNLVFLQLLLEEAGTEVINLGACPPDDLVVETARRERPDFIVVSTVNGHGFTDGARLARALRADEATRGIPAIIGGKLGITGEADAARVDALIAAGFDVVGLDTADAAVLRRFLARPPQRCVAGGRADD